jgi:ectoine hydroxylase-related dioxygenase (phytanoyl-CoA dioxygenase family)
MSNPLQTISADAPQRLFDALTRDGAVVVTDLFPTEAVEAIAGAVDAALAQVPWCNTAEEGYGAEFFGHKTKRLHGILQYSPHIEACLMHPVALATAERWLGHKPQFSTGEVMAIGPGEQQQDLHTDAASWGRSQLSGELLFSMTMALTDFTAANGATMVAPGSHRWSADRPYSDADFVPAAMSQGSALFYSGNVLHSGGANQTDTTRVGLYMGYIPFWLQPLENPVVTHPVGFLDTLNGATQQFLGYHPKGFQALLG